MAQPLFDGTTVQVQTLAGLIDVVPGGIVSKPLLDVGPLKHVLFAMDAGQELTSHRSPMLATVHVLDGRVRFTVNGTDHDLEAGDWLLMPPDAPHEAKADEPVRFLLTLVRQQ